jgi:membrane-associated phospholipid phosphatase
LESQLAADIAAVPAATRDEFVEGVAIGRSLGDVVVARGKADGFTNADGTAKVWDPSTLPSGPGIWAMDFDATPHVPAGFQFPTMKPYYLESPNQFRPAPPQTSVSVATAEVVDIVDHRGAAGTAIAIFWNFNAPSVTPLGYWDQQTAIYIKEHALDERAATHVFALVNTAAMDAVTGCWDAKFYYLVPRPWQVDPVGLPNSKLVIGRPNHPSYPSGHSCVSAAAAAVLEHFFPEKKQTLDAQVAEAGMSRVYAGIHYIMDIEAGQGLGRSVARWAMHYDQRYGLLEAILPNSTHHDHDNRP